MNVKLISITPECEKVIEEAGRTCYNSKRNDPTIIQNWIKSGHHSVIEHSSATFRIEGISRACSHQLVRHRLASFCLSGDTKILRFNQNRDHLTIKDLYYRSLDNNKNGRNKLLKIRSVNENNIIVKNKIKNIFHSGKKEVFELKTKLGYSIKASKDHVFFNTSGEVKLGSLSKGDCVFINGIELYKDKKWFEDKYNGGLNTTQIAELCGIEATTARKWMKRHGIKKNNQYKSREPWNRGVTGKDSHSYGKTLSEETKKKLSEAKKGLKIKDIEDMSESGKRLRFSKKPKTKCELCGEIRYLENHHIDKNINNDSDENCLTVCSKCHKLIHKGYNSKQVVLDEIVSIKNKGIEETYDIEMCEPYHNFIANGFLVHNSQRSQRYVGQDTAEFVIPESIKENEKALEVYEYMVSEMIEAYETLRDYGIKKEDARFLLPNAITTEIVMTMNFRSFRNFFELRCDKYAQWEIREMALKILVVLYEHAPNVFGDLYEKFIVGEVV